MERGQIEIVRLLLRGGASAAACNDSGQTPMNIARFNVAVGLRNQSLLDMLLEYED